MHSNIRRNNIKIGIPQCRLIVLFIHQNANITHIWYLANYVTSVRAILGSDYNSNISVRDNVLQIQFEIPF